VLCYCELPDSRLQYRLAIGGDFLKLLLCRLADDADEVQFCSVQLPKLPGVLLLELLDGGIVFGNVEIDGPGPSAAP